MLTGVTQLWAGGYGVKPIRKPIDGGCLGANSEDRFDCLPRWRSAAGGKTAN